MAAKKKSEASAKKKSSAGGAIRKAKGPAKKKSALGSGKAKAGTGGAAVGEPEGELIKRALRLSKQLRKLYGSKGTALSYDDPFQLLVATILSAQCTDAQVNRVTPVLFAAFADPMAMAAAPIEKIEEIIHSTGFFRQKARSVQKVSASLLEKFDGRVPESMEELTSLAGVGRKTANLVRAMAFGHPGLIVDTHFKRVSNRLGLVAVADPTKIESRVAELLPDSHWTEFSNAMIWHGRDYCDSRKPNCAECPVLAECPYGAEQI